MFQRYDEKGTLLYERRIQGRELDPLHRAVSRRGGRGARSATTEIPLVSPTVRTARVDPMGRLWVSLIVPFTYVYDLDGDKVGSVQFRAAGVIAPTSLYFATGWRIFVTPGLYEFHMVRSRTSRREYRASSRSVLSSLSSVMTEHRRVCGGW